MNDAIQTALQALRGICANLPDAAEGLTFSNPTFKVAGKSFAVLDSYKGIDCLWLRIDPGRRSEMLAEPGWFKAPYDRREEALCWNLRNVDWAIATSLIGDSYRMAIEK
jgi:predicted DNA-binding protein (MmcQ/YjbR family)